MEETAIGTGVGAKSHLDQGSYYRWVEPNSKITVCLKLEAMDRLQVAVLRGKGVSGGAGKEVGGILLGRTEMEKGRTLIYVDEFEPVACGRRDEPFYVLGREDLARFGVALERAQVREAGSAVGYYRSHNRNGMFLAPEDVRLIHAHFSAPDNLFLLVKTLRNQACTAGFFFWKDGHLQSEFTDSEAPLIPVSLSTSGASLAEPAPEELPAIALPPLQKAAQRRRWIAPLLAAGVAAAVTVGVIAYRPSRPSPSTRAVANPQIASQAAPAAPPPVQAPAPAPARSAAKLPQAAPAEHRRAPAVPFRGELRLPLPEDVLQPALAIPPAAATGAPAAPTTPSPPRTRLAFTL